MQKIHQHAEVFDALNAVNVNGHTEVKKAGNTQLTYLSWAWAWAEVKKRYPDANYEIKMFGNVPYMFDPKTGYMVMTSMTIDGQTHDMWLPVMDNNNKAMKDEPYTVKTKYSEINVAAATMFDVNKAMMRCLVKNIGMFGLGLYIYAGEDLPESEAAEEERKNYNFKSDLAAWLAKHSMPPAVFMAFRSEAIKEGLVQDIASGDMTKEDAEKLFSIVETKAGMAVQ